MPSAASTASAPPLPPPERVTKAALARLLGCSRQSIGELVQRGIVPADADGMIDVAAAKAAIAATVRPHGKTAAAVAEAAPAGATPAAPAPAAAPQAPNEATSYHVARTLREAAEASIARLKLAEMRGELVRVADARAALARHAATYREALLQIPGRLAAQLAAEADQARVYAMLDAELRAAMAHLTEATL